MVLPTGNARKAAKRTSRHKKKYWRKGTEITDVEDAMLAKAYGKADLKDDGDVTIERSSLQEGQRTKRQQAALDKISRSIGEQKVPLPAPTFPSKKQRKLKQPVVPQVVSEPVKRKDTYDLWEADFVPKVDLEFKEAGEHMLRYTKKKLPKMPKTCRFKPSLLDAVSLPAAGASYNPTSEDYQEYVTKIAQDEVELMKEEERIQNAGKPKTESIVTHAERQLEVTEGLTIDPRYNADTEEVKEDEDELPAMDVGSPSGEGEKKSTDVERKTKRQRLRAAKEKKLQRELKRQKAIAKKQHDVFKAKSINKALAAEEKEILEKAAERKKKKFLRKMTTRQRLGGGEFKNCEEPFLLQEELTDSLRLLKPQNNILNDRFASLQQRNILPIGGEKNKRKLKSKLKRKFVEKRSVAAVTKGSRII